MADNRVLGATKHGLLCLFDGLWPRLALLVGFLLAAPAVASDLPVPSGRVLLTVTGAITNTNAQAAGSAAAQFDRAMLEALDWRDVLTFTAWTEGERTFSGPTLASLIAAVGAESATLRATAINDYSVDIPAGDARTYDVLLAMELDGKKLRIRDKGPIWVVYPQEASEAGKNKAHGEKMIWQLRDIAFVD
ncbi:MAG: molybdopterin-dependent oxidoreductase [Pseudomonadota bacterium]